MKTFSTFPYFIFGADTRPKFVVKPGVLLRLPCWSVVCEVDSEEMFFSESELAVTCGGEAGFTIREDSFGLWLEREGNTECLSDVKVVLPEFKGHTHSFLLRRLYHEVIVNVLDGKPLPNIIVYEKPWYRDAAMMAMVFDRVGQAGILKKWIDGIDELYDRNNAGHEEPDNLGQLLYLISLVGGSSHPLVASILDEVERRSKGNYIEGITDGSLHPVYQTKWLKFGLASLGLSDEWKLPDVEDSYAPLVWWDRSDSAKLEGDLKHSDNVPYPYLTWAEAHYHNLLAPMGLCGSDNQHLSWEAKAGEADYEKLRPVDPSLVDTSISYPHTWHAAEMFLYMYEL